MTALEFPRHESEPCRVPVPMRIPVRKPLPGSKVFGAALLSVALAMATVAQAAHWETTADGRLIDVEVIVDGSSAPLYVKSGSWDRRYFQAFRGRNYSLAVTNNSGRRVGVLISVDGLNVVNGERSSLSNHEAMYVLGPYERTVIRGWRTSLRDVRRFVFVDEERSYAERTGQANGDMGWIRVLSFHEQQPRVWDEPRVRRDDDEWRPFGSREERSESDAKAEERDSRLPMPTPINPPSAPSPPAEGNAKGQGLKRGAEQNHAQPGLGYNEAPSNPGTGWGDRSWDPVQRTVFLAANRATDHIVLRYEYASGLRALGIHPRGDRTRYRDNGDLYGFARAPRW